MELTSQGTTYDIIDIPGIEDDKYAAVIEEYISDNHMRIQPLFVIPLNQATIELKQFKQIKEIFKDQNVKIPIIFTKFQEFVISV